MGPVGGGGRRTVGAGCGRSWAVMDVGAYPWTLRYEKIFGARDAPDKNDKDKSTIAASVCGMQVSEVVLICYVSWHCGLATGPCGMGEGNWRLTCLRTR